MKRNLSSFMLALAMLLAPAVAAADPLDVAKAADAAFSRMPEIKRVASMPGNCGADGSVHPWVAYCTTDDAILVAEGAEAGPMLTYFVAHAFGHAVQVQHGIADIALREITQRREDEARLRGYVERQVDCIAGFLLRQATIPLPDLTNAFSEDPLDRPHWGRAPLARGPHLAVPVADRADWLRVGYDKGLEACAVGEFASDLLIAARNP